MRKITIAILVLFFISLQTSLKAQVTPDVLLPLDAEVKTGVLENGLTYYIRHNEEPKERASFYMIQNVGAILETDEQNGLAHFLEHMAFNGTEHFPGKGILNTLEKHGVAFGYNINAYTSQNETVYNLSDVPVDRPGLLDTCLLVLNDWSNYLLLTEDEIESERGVITEEWRTRRTADFRMRKSSMPFIYNNSKYAIRDVIGDLDVIKNFKYETIREFYHDWYRTDLQAIAIVGDFDPDEMEQKVIDLFSKIPAVDEPMDRGFTEIEDNDELIYGLVTDVEADQSIINLYIRRTVDNQGLETVGQLRKLYIEMLFNRMMSQRIAELLQKGEPPFVMGSIRTGSLARGYAAMNVMAVAKTNQEGLALKTILTEAERAKQHGFSPGELDRAKLHYVNQMEKLFNERDKISNDRFAREYQSHYLQKNAYMNIGDELNYMKGIFSSVTVNDFPVKMTEWFSEKNRTIIVQGPENDEINHLSKEEVVAIFEEVEASVIDPYEDVEVATSLISEDLPRGNIVSEKSIPELDAEEWTLDNGARVVYRYANYEKDNISFRAYSSGGSSLFDAAYIPSANMLANLVDFYGLGEYDMMTLQKMLTGKTVSLNVQLGDLSEGLTGSASPKDFETLMQLIYLRFTAPRFDEEAHQAITSRYMAYVQNMNNNPQKIMGDSLNLIMTDYNARTRVMDEHYISELDLSKIQEIYLDRYQDASDFTFFFIGNISKEELIPHVEKYIGSLPSVNREENWIDREVNEPEGIVEKEIKMTMTVPKSTVFLVYNNELDYTPYNRVMLRVIRGILELRFNESIREEEGGTYSVMTNLSLSHYPEEKANMLIMFDTDPEKAMHLKSLVYQEIEDLSTEGPAEKNLSKTVENLLKDREQDKEHNSYWLSALYNYYYQGYNFDAPENYEEILKKISVKDVKKVMKKLSKNANIIDLVFSPEEGHSHNRRLF